MDNKQLKSFKDLTVWQKAVDLAALVYSVTEKFPKSELYGVTNQMRRSAVSISSNIAEGFKRSHQKEKLQFYNVAYASTAELESQIEVSCRLNFLHDDDYQKLNTSATEIGKMIDGLIKSFNRKSPKFYILNSIFFFVFLTPIFYILNPPSTQAAVLYFGAPGQEVGLLKNFEVGVFLDTESESINAVQGEITIPVDALDLREIRDGASIINFWLERPKLAGAQIKFSGITPGGYTGGQGLLFSFVLLPKQLGKISIDAANVEVLKNDAEGSLIETRIAPLTLKVAEGVSLPEFSSPPDANPPEFFTPEIAKDLNLFGGQWFLVFATQDKGSGIDRYEVREGNRPFTVATSPYLLENQGLNREIEVRALDRSGNERLVMVKRPGQEDYFTNPLLWTALLLVIGVLYILWAWIKVKKRK